MDSITVTYGQPPNRCELICFKDTVTPYRQGKLPRSKVLVTETIYKNAQKGDQASQELIQSTFGHTDRDQAIEQMLSEGEYPMSTAELRELRDMAYCAVVTYVKKNYLNPVGDREYSESTIRTALDECRCRAKVDHRRSAEDNFLTIKKKLICKLPLKPRPGSIEYTVELTWIQHSKLYNQLKPYIQSETGTPDGTGCALVLLVPPKDMDRIAKLTA